jgi:uncharacterized membrane protein YidH (DUF202 family)
MSSFLRRKQRAADESNHTDEPLTELQQFARHIVDIDQTQERRTAMKAATVVGIILILAGFIGFAMGGFTFTHEKKDVDLGPIQIEHQQKKTVPIPPILSVIAMVGGIGLVVVGVRSK